MKLSTLIYSSLSLLIFSCSNDDDSNQEVSLCEENALVLSQEDFNSIESDYFTISNIQLSGNCLELTIIASGCNSDTWELDMYSVNSFYNSEPLTRFVKLDLWTNQACLAVLEKTVTFDLTDFQLENRNNIGLDIEGEEFVLYEY